MVAADLHEYMRSMVPDVDWEGSTCDGFKVGDPNTEVKGIVVAWMATMTTLRRAIDLGANLFVTHEPTFYSQTDHDPDLQATAPARAKRELLDQHGMVVYRCHDAWDLYPEHGIHDSWARGLGLPTPPLARDGYCAVYEVGPATVEELAGEITDRVRELGQNAVAYAGDGEQMVSRLGIGTGAGTDIHRLVALGADCILASDDSIASWCHTSWLLDAGIPVILVDHPVAEEWGMHSLAHFLRRAFSPVPVYWLKVGSFYRFVW